MPIGFQSVLVTKRLIHRLTLLTLIGMSACTAQPTNPTLSSDSVVPVSLQENAGHYQIFRQGKPYFIKGGGGSGNMALLAASGGNSVRTWDTNRAQSILDNAQQAGLTVMLGLRLGHERHGFDYSDKAAVAAQKETVRQAVLKYKDHPALLVWGIGNEVDLFYTNKDVWYAIEDIAQMIKQLDPNHLVTTVTAGIDQEKSQLIAQRVPSIDYLSINIYGGLETLPQDLLNIGYSGPYAVTEWGPTGHWQVEKTDWGVPIEQTSTEKAASYRSRYQGGIASAPKRALGSYAFLWGQKQETTPTWYGVFTEAGIPNEVVDSLQYNWTGQWPKHRAPAIKSFTLQGQQAKQSVHLKLGQINQANITLLNTFDEQVEVRWEILAESTDIKAGGDPESRPSAITGLIVEQSATNLRFTSPNKPGAYRLFVYALSNNKIANANIPFYVDAE